MRLTLNKPWQERLDRYARRFKNRKLEKKKSWKKYFEMKIQHIFLIFSIMFFLHFFDFVFQKAQAAAEHMYNMFDKSKAVDITIPEIDQRVDQTMAKINDLGLSPIKSTSTQFPSNEGMNDTRNQIAQERSHKELDLRNKHLRKLILLAFPGIKLKSTKYNLICKFVMFKL